MAKIDKVPQSLDYQLQTKIINVAIVNNYGLGCLYGGFRITILKKIAGLLTRMAPFKHTIFIRNVLTYIFHVQSQLLKIHNIPQRDQVR